MVSERARSGAAPGSQAAAAQAAVAAQAALRTATAALAAARQAAAAGGQPGAADADAQVAVATDLLQRAQMLQQRVSFSHDQTVTSEVLQSNVRQEEILKQLQTHISASCLAATHDSAASSVAPPTRPHGAFDLPVAMSAPLFGVSRGQMHAQRAPNAGAAGRPFTPALVDQPSIGLGSFSLWPGDSPGASAAAAQPPLQPRSGASAPLPLLGGGQAPAAQPMRAGGDLAGMSFEQLVALRELSALLSTGPPL